MKLLVLVLLFCSNSFANGFLGNPGKGVLVQDKVFLQDLYSLGVHNNPYFGSETLSQFQELPDLGFSYPKELLSRKLSDIEAAVPGLGTCILESMKVYDWFIIKEDLKVITDDNDPVALPEGALLIQVANRRNASIRINEDAWTKLDDANKVALIIHEAVYSFVKPKPKGDGIWEQPAETVREFTGNSFTSSFKRSNYAAQLRDNPRNHGLNIYYIPAHAVDELKYQFLFSDAKGVRRPQKDHLDIFNNLNEKALINEQLKRKCEQVIADAKKLNGTYAIKTTITKYANELQRDYYNVGELRQLALRFFPASYSLYNQEPKVITSVIDCETEVSKALNY